MFLHLNLNPLVTFWTSMTPHLQQLFLHRLLVLCLCSNPKVLVRLLFLLYLRATLSVIPLPLRHLLAQVSSLSHCRFQGTLTS